MKLVTVLMLTALPLCCYAGPGCKFLESAINKTIDPDVSLSEYIDDIKEFLPGEDSENAAKLMKIIFLYIKRGSLKEVKEMQEVIYTSSECAAY